MDQIMLRADWLEPNNDTGKGSADKARLAFKNDLATFFYASFFKPGRIAKLRQLFRKPSGRWFIDISRAFHVKGLMGPFGVKLF